MNEEIFQECYQKYLQAKTGEPFWKELADKFGYSSGDQLRCAIKNERVKRGLPPKGIIIDKDGKVNPKKYESQQINGDGSMLLNKMFFVSDEDAKDPEKIMKDAGLNPDKFDLVEARFGAWDTYNGKPFRTGSIKVKPKKKKGITFSDIDIWFEKHKDRLSKNSIKIKSHNTKDGLIVELLLADLHWGKIGIDEKNGVSSLLEDLMFVIGDFYSQIKDIKIKKIVICDLGDMFHFEGKKRQTTRGTQMITDGRTPEVLFDEALDAFIEIINLFSELADVLFVHIPGNHDATTGYYLAKSLEMHYLKSDRVEIDVEHESRKFRLFGKCLIAWIHGEANRKRLENNFLQVEAKELWSKARFKECHVGHIHSEKTSNSGGIIFRNILSLSKTDEWHSSNLYIGNERGIQGFVWDEKKGLKQILFSKPEED